MNYMYDDFHDHYMGAYRLLCRRQSLLTTVISNMVTEQGKGFLWRESKSR